MFFDLPTIRDKTVSIIDYMKSLEEPFRGEFLARKQTYEINQETVNQLKKCAENYVIIVFSAAWCKDCAVNIPVLALISEASGLEVRVFGGLKRDPLSQGHKWRIPPSPQEVETFDVDKIPLIMVADRKGREIGRIVEKPTRQPTLEQELCVIMKDRRWPRLRTRHRYGFRVLRKLQSVILFWRICF